ncbi:TetR/AcrR family transcriptional regulator [Ferdinandcohnia quinoae]|uniref:TetR/AcrR family transcriptional regulator n=1 Tax=Fredinandcohnia quinoae TaxID=2918902 RepID=A0AAW5E0R9_9BACI|nr:TetR/AcrR family transcriptional regulator [Fredinandcohnia sp. SECRCQ15]MCH1626505.1 TetR/AcrR family transcriptional regulator [Fredinandcohnia sp. SECRCQ15]
MDGFQRRREQKKINILEAALSLFMEFGVKKIAISEIAKEANVSQVTIYNYFESKHNLVHETFLYYLDKASDEFDQIINNNTIDFPEKIKQIVFAKKEAAQQIHEDFYDYLMKEYTTDKNYMEKIYVEQAIPRFIVLFDEGKKHGYVDPNLSNEAILLFIQAFHDYIQREEVYQKILPITEDIMNLIFYGIVGKRD